MVATSGRFTSTTMPGHIGNVTLVFVAPLCGTLPLVFFSSVTSCTKHAAFQVPIWILFLSSFTATSASGPKAPVCAHSSAKAKIFSVC